MITNWCLEKVFSQEAMDLIKHLLWILIVIFFPTGSNIIHDGIESWSVITSAAPSWMILIKKPLVILVAVHSTVWFQCESCLNVRSSRSSTWPAARGTRAAHMPDVFIEPQARHVDRCVGSVRLRVHLWLRILLRTKKKQTLITVIQYTEFQMQVHNVSALY